MTSNMQISFDTLCLKKRKVDQENQGISFLLLDVLLTLITVTITIDYCYVVLKFFIKRSRDVFLTPD